MLFPLPTLIAELKFLLLILLYMCVSSIIHIRNKQHTNKILFLFNYIIKIKHVFMLLCTRTYVKNRKKKVR